MSQYRIFDAAYSIHIILIMRIFSKPWKISAVIGHHMVTRKRNEPAIWINTNFSKSYSRNLVRSGCQVAVGHQSARSSHWLSARKQTYAA